MAGRSPELAGRRRRGGSTTPNASPPPPPRSPSHSSPPSPAQQAGPMAPGTEVEVRLDDDGFHGSWFEAIVGGFVPARSRRSPARYTVTYSHLLSDHGATLVESFGPSHIRPRPPPPSSPEEPLQLHDIVEAFHNDGWWSGIVLATDPLTVAFPITREVITFPPHLVRRRRDYVDGQWVPSQAAMVVQPKLAIRVYEVGDKVEVVRDREVYGYSWFPATVAKVIDSLSYLVEYFDLEEGEGGAKAMEYLHWRFIRPAVEHSPRESEFRLGPGTAVEAYCDGVWSPGVVRRVVGEGEYEVSVDGKETELLLMKVPELLKPQYKWNGKHWRIVSPKRQGNRRQSLSGKRPSSPVRVTSIDDEHRRDTESSATKRSRKELQQIEVMLTEGSEHASEFEMDTPLSALCKSPARNHSPQSYSPLSGKNNFQVLSKKVVSGCAVPTKGFLDASSGHPTPQNELRTNGIGETVVNEEILSDMMLSECQINTPICGTSADEARDLISIAELRKQKMASSRRKSAVQQTQERPLSAQALQVKKNTSKQKRGKMNPILAPQGKNDASDNIQLKGNNNFSSKEVICALNASTKCNTPSPLDEQIRASDAVSRGADSGSNTKVLTSKKLARKKGFKESSSPHSSLDVTSTVQQRGRKKVAGRLSGSNRKVLTSKKLARKKGFKESSSPHSSLDATGTVQQRGRKKVAGRLKESSIERQLERSGPHARQLLNRTLEDKMNVNDATNQELLPIIPPGLESNGNGKGCEWNADGVPETDIHSSLLDEELAATINNTCQANQNADAFTDNAATQVAEITRLMGKPMLSLDCAVQQDGGKVDERPIILHFQNAGSSQFTMDNTLLRRCSVAGSSMPSHLPLCQISGQQVPFMKTSPVWSLIEAMDVFLKVPQRPHFLPLQQFLPALREGMALGLMVSYASLVESIKKSLIADSIASFEEKINTLAHLEENGFNVQFLQPSLNKLLQIKSDYTKYLGDRDKLKEQVQGKASSVSRMDALLDENKKAIFQLEQKLELLRREAEQIARNKEEEDAELSRLKAEDNIVQEACGDAERQFRSILAELR